MGLPIRKLDTLDATEHMALSWRHKTPRGGKRTCFRNDDTHHNMQRSPVL